VFRVNGVKVGVIGAELETTPELVAAGNTAGLKFLPRPTGSPRSRGGCTIAASTSRSW
jgi:hypothetical protein